MAFKMTDNQRQAVRAEGCVLVSAAAGAGKTAVLVERVIDRIIRDVNPIDSDKLLVVTFTNAAAQEMRSRILVRIDEEIKKFPNNLRLLKQKILFSKANICTIDSFCIGLVRENFQYLFLAPDFKLLDEPQLTSLKSRAMEITLNHYYDNNDEDFSNLLSSLGATNRDDSLINAINAVYNHIRSLPYPDEWLENAVKMYESCNLDEDCGWTNSILNFAHTQLLQVYSDLKRTAEKCKEDERLFNAYYAAFCEDIRNVEEIISKIEQRNYSLTRQRVLSYSPSKLKTLRGYEDTEFKERFKTIKKASNETIEDLGKRLFHETLEQCKDDINVLRPVVKKLFEVLKFYMMSLNEIKKSEKLCDFADIEYAALSLLVNRENGESAPSQLSKELMQKYDEVMVDEYQDTNDLQNAIFFALSNEGKNIFMVGDVKQSIYRFRKANPGNFMEKIKEYDVYDGIKTQSKITLSQNFRSRDGICNSVNFFFKLLMSEDVGEMFYTKEHELLAGATFPERNLCDTEIHIITRENLQEDSENNEKLESYMVEAHHIADIIEDMMSKECITDKKTGELRKASYGDFAILMRSPKTKAPQMARILSKRGIAVWADIKDGLTKAKEICWALSILKVIDNPLLNIPILSAMMSPAFGFTAEEIAILRADDKTKQIYTQVASATKEGNKKCEDFIKTIEKLRQSAVTMPIDKLIRTVYDKTHLVSYVQAMQNGAQRRANLLLLLDYAAQCEQSGINGLGGFLRFMDRIDENNSQLSPAMILGEQDDVVKIMSIHHSKGLEFPVVIIANCCAKMNITDLNAPIVLSEKEGLGLSLVDKNKRIRYTTLPREAVSIANNKAMKSEELRVLYVAMTRAKENLILLVSLDNPSKTIANIAQRAENSICYYGENTEAFYLNPMTVLNSASYGEWILSCALFHESAKELRRQANVFLPPIQSNFQLAINNYCVEIPTEKEEETIEIPPDAGLVEKIKNKISYVYPFSELNGVAAKRAVTQIAQGALSYKYTCTATPQFMSKGGLTPPERGTALHLFMEKADFSAALLDIKAEIKRLLEGGFITKKQALAVDEVKIQKFIKTPLFERMMNSEKLLREMRFMVELPATQVDTNLPEKFNNEMVVIQGKADCVFIEDEQAVIIDYKTDRFDSIEEIRNHYSEQLKIYAAAISKALNLPISECIIYSLHYSVEIQVEI